MALRTQTIEERAITIDGLAVGPSRYTDSEVLNLIHLEDTIDSLFQRIGWDHIMEEKWVTYEELTREFLKSIVVRKVGGVPTSIKFKLGGMTRILNREELDHILHTPTETSIPKDAPFRKEDEGMDFGRLWPEIADDEMRGDPVLWVHNNAKAAAICHPTLSYAQRVLGNSIFGRHEPGHINTEELFALYCMIEGYQLSLSPLLMNFWDRAKDQRQGVIRCGGLVTPIALHCGIDLNGYTPVPAHNIDGRTLMNGDFLNRRSGWYYFKLKNAQLCFHDPTLTTIGGFDNRQNWKMDSSAHWQY